MARLAAIGPDSQGEGVLFADSEGAQAVAAALRGDSGGAAVFELGDPPPGADAPALGLVSVRPDSGKVEIAADGSELRIVGDPSHLAAFGAFIDDFLAHNEIDAPGEHTHVSPGLGGSEDWLSETSTQLVLSGWSGVYGS